MKKYDDIIIGSGISGLSAALLFAQNGRKVLLIEKAPKLGGSLSRFYKDGIPFDVGFHFTGGLKTGEVLSSMLSALGIRDKIKPLFINSSKNTIVFEQSKEKNEISSGIQEFGVTLKNKFPEEAKAVDSYTSFIQKIYDETVLLDLKDITQLTHRLDEDYITFEDALNKLTDNSALKSLLTSYCLCYGTEPSEISYADHARITAAMYESVARIEGGGDSIIEAFRDRFAEFNVDISLNTYIKHFSVENKFVKECVLNTGEELTANNYLFAIHPKEIMKILPEEHLTKGFTQRVSDFEESVGFFSLYCELENEDFDTGASITTLYPNSDLEKLFGHNDLTRPMTIFKNLTFGKNGKKHLILNVLEPSFVDDVEKWEGTTHKSRTKEYKQYKKDRTERILKRIYKIFPEYKNKLKILDSASMLTFRDYLHSSKGSAYGIKQNMGQFNAFGRLPIRNVYAIGQSSVLPGIVGSMLSSFILARALLGEEKYNKLIR